MASQFSLGKNERLKSRKLIEQVFSEGKTIQVPTIKVFYLIDETGAKPLQFGVGVGSKNFRRAVDRNRIKRLIRESYRLQKNDLQLKAKAAGRQVNLFIIYTGKQLPVYEEIFERVGSAIAKIDLKVVINK